MLSCSRARLLCRQRRSSLRALTGNSVSRASTLSENLSYYPLCAQRCLLHSQQQGGHASGQPGGGKPTVSPAKEKTESQLEMERRFRAMGLMDPGPVVSAHTERTHSPRQHPLSSGDGGRASGGDNNSSNRSSPNLSTSTPTTAAQRMSFSSPINLSAPPPPTPQELGNALPNGGRGGGAGDANGPKPLRTTLEILDVLVEFVPTFYVSAEAVEATLPTAVQVLYNHETTLPFFLKRFRHYIDIRTSHGHSQIRLRPDFSHAKRGAADGRHSVGPVVASSASAGGGQAGAQTLDSGGFAANGAVPARPARHTEAHLVSLIAPRVPTEYTPLPEVLLDLGDAVARHPAADPRVGVVGFFERHPQYFQIRDGQLRARPHRSAPFSLDDLGADDSPLPAVAARLIAAVEAAAASKDLADEQQRRAAAVPTGRLYAMLSAEEKAEVKRRCRSFPRFLRLHGRALVVAPDHLSVRAFRPEHEPCAATLLGEHLRRHSIRPDDPLLKVPATMEEPDAGAGGEADADADGWAVRELYEALPLQTCALLEDMLVLVPSSVRAALPSDTDALVAALRRHPRYFTLWQFPDDTTVWLVQRAAVAALPQPTRDEVARALATVLSSPASSSSSSSSSAGGGEDLERVRRRLPLPVQLYLYRHGYRTTLAEMKDMFCVSGNRLIRTR